MSQISISFLQILSLVSLFQITWPTDWTIQETIQPIHWVSLSFTYLKSMPESVWPTFIMGISISPLLIYYLDHGLFLERNDDDRVQRCLKDPFWREHFKPYLVNRLLLPIFPMICGGAYVIFPDDFATPTLIISGLSIFCWSFIMIKGIVQGLSARATSNSIGTIDDDSINNQLFQYIFFFVAVLPLQIAHVVLVVSDSDSSARYILPIATSVLTGLPTIYVGYTVLECGGFEQSLRRKEVSSYTINVNIQPVRPHPLRPVPLADHRGLLPLGSAHRSVRGVALDLRAEVVQQRLHARGGDGRVHGRPDLVPRRDGHQLRAVELPPEHLRELPGVGQGLPGGTNPNP